MASQLNKVGSEAVSEAAAVAQRQELIAKVLSSFAGLAVSGVISYYGIKWLVKTLDPTHKEKEASKKKADALLKKIGVKGFELSEYELCVASNLIDPSSMSISWSDIGGLQNVIKDIKESIIFPFKQPELFADSLLLQPPKGVLLYGPPGCGKTMIAKATAKAAGARFINLQLSSLFDKWYGESQKRAEAVFSLAIKIQPCIIFIDEIDSFLRSRSGTDHEATAMIKTQFMSWWDGITTNPKNHVLIMGATNRPQDVDAAILRRMPATFKIDYPNRFQRKEILKLVLSTERVSCDVDEAYLASRTEGFTGSDLKELCRLAALSTVRELFDDYESETYKLAHEQRRDVLRDITTRDFNDALVRFNRSKLGGALQTDIPLE